MPLVRFDIVEGRSDSQVQAMLDAAHRALLKAFKVPERDRYQIVNEHPPTRMIIEDTGLGIVRTENVVVVTITTQPRTQSSKQTFYAELCRELEAHCDIAASEVMVSIVTNTPEDWSFGNGQAQFLTGRL